jgi:hypothetical protein
VKSIVGIFQNRASAISAANRLRSLGFDGPNLTVFSPGQNAPDLNAAPTDEGEQPGMGAALGSVVGGALGLGAGAVAANLLLPGIGPVIALTLGAAAAAGLGGAAAGGLVGRALEQHLSMGVPKDEIFFYEQALRDGHSVVVAASDRDDQLDEGRLALQQAGAESLDAAREKWWIGVRDVEQRSYSAPEEFRQVEHTFRSGFAAALEPELRGRPYAASTAYLKQRYPNEYDQESFRRGYDRGQEYYRQFLSDKARA